MPTRMRCRSTKAGRLDCRMGPKGRPQAGRAKAQESVLAKAQVLVLDVAAALGLAKAAIPAAAASGLEAAAVLKKLAGTVLANRLSFTKSGRSTPKKRGRIKCKAQFCSAQSSRRMAASLGSKLCAHCRMD